MSQDLQFKDGSNASEKNNEGFSLKTLEHIMQPRNFEEMTDHNGFALVEGECGDRMAFFLRIESGIIKKAAFVTDGCGATIACGSACSEEVTNDNINKAFSFSSADLINLLGGLPVDHEHCASLAVRAMRLAILNYRQRIKENSNV